MIISFVGHSDYSKNEEDEKKVLAFLDKKVGDKQCLFYLGGYGSFDAFSRDCCLKYKEKHPNVKLILVIPYLNREYDTRGYDETLYPPLENVPLKFAISRRNIYMVEASDYIIAYVWHYGGARTALDIARQKKKPIYNLVDGAG